MAKKRVIQVRKTEFLRDELTFKPIEKITATDDSVYYVKTKLIKDGDLLILNELKEKYRVHKLWEIVDCDE